MFRQLWANNGDSISKIYTGTGATTSSTTRKGNNSGITSILDHGVKTISRFYLNNFDDFFKQEIINILLNTKSTTVRGRGTNFSEMPDFTVSFFSIFEYKKMEFLPIDRNWLRTALE